MRIPGRDDLARFNLGTVFYQDGGAIRHLVTLALATELIHDTHLTGARHCNPVTLLMVDHLDVVQTQYATALDFHAVHSRGTGCSTTNMEGTHGQLGTRLTN